MIGRTEQFVRAALRLFAVCAAVLAWQPSAVADVRVITREDRTGSHQKFVQKKELADKGSDSAQVDVGIMYFVGHGVPENKKLAARYFAMAAKRYNADAEALLGYCYQYGHGVKTDTQKALKLYKRASAKDNKLAQRQLAAWYLEGHRYCDFVEMAEKCVSTKGRIISEFADTLDMTLIEYALGMALKYGSKGGFKGVGRAPRKAFQHLRRAANKGYANAQFECGVCYSTGEGVEKDAEKAIRYFEKAAEQGHGDALCTLGNCYYKGTGVKRDMRLAKRLLAKSAAQGNAKACLLILEIAKEEEWMQQEEERRRREEERLRREEEERRKEEERLKQEEERRKREEEMRKREAERKKREAEEAKRKREKAEDEERERRNEEAAREFLLREKRGQSASSVRARYNSLLEFYDLQELFYGDGTKRGGIFNLELSNSSATLFSIRWEYSANGNSYFEWPPGIPKGVALELMKLRALLSVL